MEGSSEWKVGYLSSKSCKKDSVSFRFDIFVICNICIYSKSPPINNNNNRPPIKAKRPWMPPTSAKPSFSTSSNTSNTPSPHITNTTTTMPYSYPPPPTAMYTPPPAQPPMQAYGQPSAVPVVANNEQHGEEGGDKKVHNMARKFGGNVATAATWGFGATCKYNKFIVFLVLNY